MSKTCNQEDGGTFPFRDEIFHWPIAQLENIDVWELIFEKYLTSPLDRKNLLVASPQFFGPYLEEEKCSVLLGEVLHILHKNNYLNITNTAFLDFRTLSKSCKTAIDTCLQLDNPCFQNLDGIDHEHEKSFNLQQHARCWEHSLPISSRKHKMSQRIKDCASMIRRGVLNLTESNQFLFGYLGFSPNSIFNLQGTELLDLRKDFKTILPIIGSQIFHFKFEFFYIDNWHVEDLLCDFLGMMPNLRTFTLQYISQADSSFSRPSFQLDYKLPSLDHLEVLRTKHVPTKLVSALISKYGRHLQKLSVIPFEDGLDYAHENGIFFPANNLQELSLPRITTDFGIGQYLRENIKQNSSLKCLHVSIEVGLTQRTGTFQELLIALREIFETGRLYTLNLSVELWPYWQNKNGKNFYNTEVQLKLPFLRRLWIRTSSVELSSIDFILGVSDSLEELVLNMSRCTPKDNGETKIILFARCWKKMRESNIWKLMPMLKKVTIRTAVYSPNGLQEYISNRPST